MFTMQKFERMSYDRVFEIDVLSNEEKNRGGNEKIYRR